LPTLCPPGNAEKNKVGDDVILVDGLLAKLPTDAQPLTAATGYQERIHSDAAGIPDHHPSFLIANLPLEVGGKPRCQQETIVKELFEAFAVRRREHLIARGEDGGLEGD
jgi:hypothetical protein